MQNTRRVLEKLAGGPGGEFTVNYAQDPTKQAPAVKKPKVTKPLPAQAGVDDLGKPMGMDDLGKPKSTPQVGAFGGKVQKPPAVGTAQPTSPTQAQTGIPPKADYSPMARKARNLATAVTKPAYQPGRDMVSNNFAARQKANPARTLMDVGNTAASLSRAARTITPLNPSKKSGPSLPGAARYHSSLPKKPKM